MGVFGQRVKGVRGRLNIESLGVGAEGWGVGVWRDYTRVNSGRMWEEFQSNLNMQNRIL